jgi:hypothetical protein
MSGDGLLTTKYKQQHSRNQQQELNAGGAENGLYREAFSPPHMG